MEGIWDSDEPLPDEDKFNRATQRNATCKCCENRNEYSHFIMLYDGGGVCDKCSHDVCDKHWLADYAICHDCYYKGLKTYRTDDHGLHEGIWDTDDALPDDDRFTRGSIYDIIDDRPDYILIKDMNGPMSVTNDAERVVEELFAQGRITGRNRLYYVDSTGRADELIYRVSKEHPLGVRFVGFGNVEPKHVKAVYDTIG
jgi:hypothetical protein